MARTPSPWYWPERNGWYTILNGQRQHLGDHPPNTPPPQKRKGKWVAPVSITTAFHELMAKPPEAKPKPKADEGPTVADVFEKYLEWCQKHRAGRTYDWYKEHIQDFVETLPDPATMPVASLKRFHVVEWSDKHTTWGDAYRRGAIIAIQRPFNWAAKLGYIDASPIRTVDKPQPKRREEAVTSANWVEIRDRYEEGDPFRDLLEFCWESGCRPQEARSIEPRHVHIDRMCVLFPPDEAKGKKRWRIIRLTERAAGILRARLDNAAEAPLFRNEDGNSWTAFAINCRFCRLQVAMGKEKMKEQGITVDEEEVARIAATLRKKKRTKGRVVAKTDAELREEARTKATAKVARKLGVKFFAYAFRHGFATRKLLEGHDHLTVAELLGHRDGTMLSQVYSHLNQHDEHLRKALDGAPKDADA